MGGQSLSCPFLWVRPWLLYHKLGFVVEFFLRLLIFRSPPSVALGMVPCLVGCSVASLASSWYMAIETTYEVLASVLRREQLFWREPVWTFTLALLLTKYISPFPPTQEANGDTAYLLWWPRGPCELLYPRTHHMCIADPAGQTRVIQRSFSLIVALPPNHIDSPFLIHPLFIMEWMCHNTHPKLRVC